jgi:hypothetical protein
MEEKVYDANLNMARTIRAEDENSFLFLIWAVAGIEVGKTAMIYQHSKEKAQPSNVYEWIFSILYNVQHTHNSIQLTPMYSYQRK